MFVPVLRPAALRRWAGCALACSGLVAGWPSVAGAQSLFETSPVDVQKFVLVSAPIGTSGDRSQLNIYEQISPKRPCFSVGSGKPAAVEPLLASFDFTGICGRFIDANGFSLRIGGTDLATMYRLSVRRTGDDTLLLALPTKAGAGPELVVARTQGSGTGFLKFEFEPGWTLMRRAFRGRLLGHVYVYASDWPGAPGAGAAVTPVQPAPKKPASGASLGPAGASQPTASGKPSPLPAGSASSPATSAAVAPPALPSLPKAGGQRGS